MGIDLTLKTESINEENDIRGEGTFGFRTVAVGQMAGGERDDSSEIEQTTRFTNHISLSLHSCFHKSNQNRYTHDYVCLFTNLQVYNI